MPKLLTQDEIFLNVKKHGFEPISLTIVDGKRRLDVKCHCGNTFNVSYKHLVGNHTKSCGCLQKQNLVDKRFGKLVVIKEIPKKNKSYRARWWLCQCDCGNFRETITASLIKGSVFTCGCSRFGENSRQWTGYKCISGSFWASLKWSSKKRNLKLSITKQYAYSVLENQKFCCALTGVPISIHSQGEKTTASLDRIDSSKGYIEGNVQWVHKNINIMKWDLSQSDFISWCQKVYSHHYEVDKSKISDKLAGDE